MWCELFIDFMYLLWFDCQDDYVVVGQFCVWGGGGVGVLGLFGVVVGGLGWVYYYDVGVVCFFGNQVVDEGCCYVVVVDEVEFQSVEYESGGVKENRNLGVGILLCFEDGVVDVYNCGVFGNCVFQVGRYVY